MHYRIAGENNFPVIYLGEDTTYTIIGLTPNTRYHIDMTLRDNDGNGRDPAEHALGPLTLAVEVYDFMGWMDSAEWQIDIIESAK